MVRQGCDQTQSPGRPKPADPEAQHPLYVQRRGAQAVSSTRAELGSRHCKLPVVVFTQGDPAGIGPEILLAVLNDAEVDKSYRPLLILERAAAVAVRRHVPKALWNRLSFLDPGESLETSLAGGDRITVVDPVGRDRPVTPGAATAADAHGGLAALDVAIHFMRAGLADALVTAPLNKALIAHHVLPGFSGHTDYIAQAVGLEHYGRDYLMGFIAPDFRVALLSMHVPLSAALAAVSHESVLAAVRCLAQHVNGRIAVAGLNPHAGEGGLFGYEEELVIRPAIEAARQEGIDVHGPESPDSLFARARRGEFDWVLALYHDQGLIAVKTAAFGTATNWTIGLPFLRTSVDHGTAYDIAGKGLADSTSLRQVIQQTLRLLNMQRGSSTSRRHSPMIG